MVSSHKGQEDQAELEDNIWLFDWKISPLVWSWWEVITGDIILSKVFKDSNVF